MKDLIIIGARNYGREVFHMAEQCIGFKTDFTIKGYLDDDSKALSQYNIYPPVLGAVENYSIQENDFFICALGDPVQKRNYIEMIKEKGGRFLSLIHTSTILYKDCMIGEGVIISQFCTISCNVTLDDFVTVHAYANFGHDAKVGVYCTVGSYVFLGGFAEVGSGTILHTGSKILPHKKIGNNTIVGAGSIVIRNVKDGKTVFGNPAMEL